MAIDFIKDLNKAQQDAVMHSDGPSMVIAGAGSGKTRVLTYRVAYLIANGADPFRILALTFTNKAAREMKERIKELVGSPARNVWMGTFHSIFARVLRVEGHRLGYTTNYSIYDTEDARKLLRNIIKGMNLDPKVYTPNYVHARISMAKNNLINPAEYIDNPELQTADQMGGKPFIGQIYSIYNTRLKKADAMDFDDLLFNTYLLLSNFGDVLIKYQRKFEYILVDEYQDTNQVQYRIVKMLAANNENICVVGDDAQSIYAFRGANIRNILNFRSDYPDYALFKLEQNYRSTKNIVNAANSIIKNNKDQIQKKVWTDNDDGFRIKIIRAKSDSEEGSLVGNAIFETKMNEKLGNSAFAILYRTNAQSRAFEESLRKLGIPYRIYGGLSFYQRKEIKDLLAYYRLTINPKDEEALQRIINYPARGIGKTTIEKLVVAADSAGVSLWEAAMNPQNSRLDVNSGTRNKLQQFVTMIQSFSAMQQSKDAYELAKHIASSSGVLKDLYEDQTPEGLSRYENIEELLNAIKDFTEQALVDEETGETRVHRLADFLQDVALLTDADKKDKDNPDHVSLMTVHAAKGLEFPHIFLVGMEENLFPSIQSLNNRADLEEERRLFYVGVTRGMKSVSLAYAENRYRWGNLTFCEPSRFIDEIDESYLDRPHKVHIPGRDTAPGKSSGKVYTPGFSNLKNRKLTKIKDASSKTPTAGDFETPDDLQVGMQVEHQRFGKGKVVSVEGQADNKKATVFFKEIGQKQLLLKFAKLKIL